jgi:hypothetical protein
MEEILVKACQAQTRKNGVAALTLKIELPGEMNAHQRKEIAEAIAGYFEGRDCPCHWAVHSHNEKMAYQPHLHMTVTNRAVREVGGSWIAEAAGTRGRPGSRPIIDGPAEMKQFRREVVAAAINAVAERHGVALAAAWHGGTLRETGIDRLAKKRIPMAAYKGQLTPRPDGPAWANSRIEQGDTEAVTEARQQWSQEQIQARRARAAERAAAKEVRRLAKLAELGGVPKEAVAPAALAASRPLEALTAKQVETLVEVHERLGLEAPDLGSHEGRAAAWAVVKAEKAMREAKGAKKAPEAPGARDWAAMRQAEFMSAKGVRVEQTGLRRLDWEVRVPGGVKIAVTAKNEADAKAAAHRHLVKAALAEGRTLPPAVLADHPNLTPKEPDLAESGVQIVGRLDWRRALHQLDADLKLPLGAGRKEVWAIQRVVWPFGGDELAQPLGQAQLGWLRAHRAVPCRPGSASAGFGGRPRLDF